MHGQAPIARTRVPVSVILDCLAADMNADEIIDAYITATLAGIPGGCIGYCRALRGYRQNPHS